MLRSRAFATWMCPVLVPSPVSTTPEFEVTWVGVWGYVGEVFAALESSHQRSHLPFTHSSGALPWLVSVIDTIFTSKAIHPNILLWTFSYICKKERKRKILQLQIQTCSCLENEPNTCFLATFHNQTKNELNSLWKAIIALLFPIQRAEAENGWLVSLIFTIFHKPPPSLWGHIVVLLAHFGLPVGISWWWWGRW